jgi:hypothetical protein
MPTALSFKHGTSIQTHGPAKRGAGRILSVTYFPVPDICSFTATANKYRPFTNMPTFSLTIKVLQEARSKAEK